MLLPSRRNSGETGFTLNEVLVTMSLVVLGVLGHSVSTINVMRGNTTNNEYTVAVNLAQDKLEQLKSFTTLPEMANCPSSGDVAITATGLSGGIYNRCWEVAASGLGDKLKQIDVTVSWRDHEDRSVHLSTLVYSE
jgi:Tfp pilus assembly protein PilV